MLAKAQVYNRHSVEKAQNWIDVKFHLRDTEPEPTPPTPSPQYSPFAIVSPMPESRDRELRVVDWDRLGVRLRLHWQEFLSPQRLATLP